MVPGTLIYYHRQEGMTGKDQVAKQSGFSTETEDPPTILLLALTVDI